MVNYNDNTTTPENRIASEEDMTIGEWWTTFWWKFGLVMCAVGIFVGMILYSLTMGRYTTGKMQTRIDQCQQRLTKYDVKYPWLKNNV